MDLVITVKEIKGKCPVYREKDTFILKEGYKLSAEKPVCMHSLSSIMPYHVALSNDVSPLALGLGKEDKAYVQCLDPCQYTGGGTVVFEIVKKSKKT